MARAVECVIADTCIGGVAETAKAAEKFAIEELVFLLLLHHAGAMVLKRWIRIETFQKQYGDLMEQNVQGQCILQLA